MDIAKRTKYSGRGRSISKTDKKVDINFDLNALNLMCSYILSENRNIRRSHLINMRNLFDILDMSLYQNDIEKMKRVNFIKKGLEGKILQNLRDPYIVLKYINGGIIDDDVIDINNFTSMSSDELNWINQTISEALKYSFIYNDIDRMIDICTRFKAADYRSRGAIVQEFEMLIQEIQSKFRRSRVENVSEMTFTLKDGLMDEVVKDIHEQLSNPCNKLLTGMQGINEMLGGGFESTRVYMLLGATGVGKSVTLLNLAYQIKKYNKNYKAKDPSKIPVVVYMTMENTVRETVERLFNLTAGPNAEITKYKPEEVINILRTEGELYLTDESPIDIIIKYVPDKSVDTGYLYTMTEDLEDEGYEVICLIQDHIKRIRSCYPSSDIRLELGSIVNEFKVFASIKDIPVITNSHLNRDAAKTIEEGSRANKADLTRMLGRSNIGESMLMLDNLDCAFIINTAYDAQANKYMVFKRIKMRYKATHRDYINQPFVTGNDIKLVEDFYSSVPVFKDSLQTSVEESSLYNNGISNGKSKYQNNIKNIDEVLDNSSDDDNIFTASRYSAQESRYGVIDNETTGLIAGRRSDSYIAPKKELIKIMSRVSKRSEFTGL